MCAVNRSGTLVFYAQFTDGRSGIISMPLPPNCAADYNGDGMLDMSDCDDFVQALEAGDPGADINGDRFLSFEDFDAFVAAFENGC